LRYFPSALRASFVHLAICGLLFGGSVFACAGCGGGLSGPNTNQESTLDPNNDTTRDGDIKRP
jgi:hypothetical protein